MTDEQLVIVAEHQTATHLDNNADSVAALRAIGWQALLDASIAVLAVLPPILDQASPAIAAILPAWAQGLAIATLAAISAALRRYSTSRHKSAVVTALATPAPDAVRRAYGM